MRFLSSLFSKLIALWQVFTAPLRRLLARLPFVGRLLRSPIGLALAITALLILWVASGVIRDIGKEQQIDIPLSAQQKTDQKFRVMVRMVYTVPYQRVLELQARTEANRKVTIAAETAGTVAKLPIDKGEFVKRGQIICRLETRARSAQLAEAKANQKARDIDYQAAKKLQEKGHTSRSQVAAARAAYDAARALTKSRQVELDRTKIRAPFNGVLDNVPVEIGDFISIGAPCGVILDKNPLVIVAHIAENEIANIRVGANAQARLVTGETREGKVRYIAESPDSTTRTFRTEVAIENADFALRDGISAQLTIATEQVQAGHIPQGILTLGPNGKIGVRTVNEQNDVVFEPVNVIANTIDGAWIQGLGDEARVIMIGQDFVREGQNVTPMFENAKDDAKSLEAINLETPRKK